MIINHGGYSNLSKEKVREQIEHLKEKGKEEVFIRKQKIRHLSNQTNHLRKKLEEKKQQSENEEETRRHRILKMRKLKIDAATEKFQRTPDKKTKGHYHYHNKKGSSKRKDQGSTDVLKDGSYNVRGHVIEIRNGVRVATPHEKTKPQNSQQLVPSNNILYNNNNNNNNNNISNLSTFQQSVYEPKFYLNSHLNNLLGNDQEKDFFSNNNNNRLALNHPQQLENEQSRHSVQHPDQSPLSPTDSLCSNDSLNDNGVNGIDDENMSPQCWEQRTLRSSLKDSSSVRMTESISARKVTFSDSIEFNDGDTKPIFTPPAMNIPLYKRIESAGTTTTTALSTTSFSQQKNVSTTHNTIQHANNSTAITTEQLLDQMRQEALLPRYPHNGDFSYPDSVELITRSQPPSNVAIVSPLIPNHLNENNNSNPDMKTQTKRILSSTADQNEISEGQSVGSEQQNASLDSWNSISAKDSIESSNNNNNNNNNSNSSINNNSKVDFLHNSNISGANNNNEYILSKHSNNTITTNLDSSIQTAFIYPGNTTTSDSIIHELNRKPASNVQGMSSYGNTVATCDTKLSAHSVNSSKSFTKYDTNDSQLHQQQQQQLQTSISSNDVQKQGKHEAFSYSSSSSSKAPPPLPANTNKIEPLPYTSIPKTVKSVKTPIVKPSNSNSPYYTSSPGNSYAAKHVGNSRGISAAIDINKRNDKRSNKEISKNNIYQNPQENSSLCSVANNKTNCTEISPRINKDSVDSAVSRNCNDNTSTHNTKDHYSNTDLTVKDNVIPLSPLTHFHFSNKDYDRWESEKKCNNKNNDRIDSPGNDMDEIYKSVEQSMACITFDNRSDTEHTRKNNKNNIHRPANNPSGDLFVDDDNDNDRVTQIHHLEEEKITQHQPQMERTDSEKISSAVKDGTSIPVRVHSSNVRRGRIIVSANSKKRKQPQQQQQNVNTHFAPHPPPSKTKNANKPPNSLQSNYPESSLLTKETSPRQTAVPSSLHHQRKRTNTGDRTKAFSNSRKNSQPRLVTSASSRLNSAPPISNCNVKNYKPSPSARGGSASTAKAPGIKDLYRPISATTTATFGNSALNNDHSSNNISNLQNVAHNQLPSSYRLPLDKTPTDDEINTLWANVRDCLSTEVPEHAFSDSVCVVEPKKQHQRSSSGTTFHRRSNSGNVQMSSQNHYHRQPSINNAHRRFGSQEILYRRENSYDSVNSAPCFSRRQALLPQRVNRVLSPSIYGNSNSDRSVNRKPTRVDSQHRQHVGKEEKSEVSASMASFLALEELCTQQSLTPRQAEAVFKASKSLMRKQHNSDTKPDQGVSAISLEERKVMESLERINRKLKEQEDVVQRNLTPRKDKSKK